MFGAQALINRNEIFTHAQKKNNNKNIALQQMDTTSTTSHDCTWQQLSTQRTPLSQKWREIMTMRPRDLLMSQWEMRIGAWRCRRCRARVGCSRTRNSTRRIPVAEETKRCISSIQLYVNNIFKKLFHIQCCVLSLKQLRWVIVVWLSYLIKHIKVHRSI